MTTHWIIAIGRPKLPVMSGKAMLTAVSSGTTEIPSPTSTSRNPSRSLVRAGRTASFSDVAPGSIARDERRQRDLRRHNDDAHPQYQPRLCARRPWRRRNLALARDERGAGGALSRRYAG